ncbi:hypothetical protein MC885_016608, partial [Smutsia gigantea]
MAGGADRRGQKGSQTFSGQEMEEAGPGALAGEVVQIPAKESLPPALECSPWPAFHMGHTLQASSAQRTKSTHMPQKEGASDSQCKFS